ncbi:MAG: hypothetical protein II561_03625, partial [Thermoguttaceae bacterium]|nr:hypothetical protein [Thermoguttaceae bacterium]
ILHLGFSSGLSGSYQAACIAKDNLLEKYPKAKIVIVFPARHPVAEPVFLLAPFFWSSPNSKCKHFRWKAPYNKKPRSAAGFFLPSVRLANCFGTVFYFDNSYKSSFKFFSTSASLSDILFSTRSLIFCFKNADCFQ